MRTTVLILILILLIIIGAGIFFWSKSIPQEVKEEPEEEISVPETNMKLISSAFLNNQSIPSKYTCDGENISPPLEIKDVPEEAKSLALIVDDPDAPMGTWVHWLVWGISPKVKEIAENSVPEGAIEGMTDFGKTGYGGPCPPSGEHRYFFKLYALDADLELSSEAKKEDLEKAMEDHILDKAELVGLYSKE